MVQTDEPGGEPPLDGTTDDGSSAPTVRVATALAVVRIVYPLKDTS